MAVSFARTIQLASATPDPLATLRWPAKSPGAVLDYSVDLAAVLEETSDTISSFAFSVNGSAGELVSVDQELVVPGTVVTTILSAGQSISDYSVNLIVHTAGGLVYDWDVWILVQRMSPTDTVSPPVIPGSVGPAGRSISTITQPNGPASMLVTFSDATTQLIELPQGIQGIQGEPGNPGTNGINGINGVGIQSITQPNGAGSMLITFTNGQTQNVVLPGGSLPAGQKFLIVG